MCPVSFEAPMRHSRVLEQQTTELRNSDRAIS